MTFDDLKSPWRRLPDRDGLTIVVDGEGTIVAEVEPEFAAAVEAVPELLQFVGQRLFYPCDCDQYVISKCSQCEARDLFAKAGLPVKGDDSNA